MTCTARLSCSLPFRGRVGVGARGASIERSACPHPSLPPKGEGAIRLLLLVWMLLASCSAFATQRALLVGVSELVTSRRPCGCRPRATT